MIWKIYISTFTKFMNTKLGSILTSARRPSTQTLRLSPTSCIFTSLKLFHVSIILFPRKLKNSALVFRFLKVTTYSNKARVRTNKYSSIYFKLDSTSSSYVNNCLLSLIIFRERFLKLSKSSYSVVFFLLAISCGEVTKNIKPVFQASMEIKIYYLRARQIYFYACDFSGAQFYLSTWSRTPKMGAKNKSARPVEKKLETLIFFLNYLNRIWSFHF